MQIQSETEEKKILRLIIAASEEFLQSATGNLNYQKISDDILYISGAKYAAFDLYDESGSTFTTKALSVPEGIIKKINSLLGFKLLERKWDIDPVLIDKIKSSAITHFSTLADLTGNVFPKPIVTLIEKVIDTGEVVYVKILKEKKMVGSFTLLMPKDAGFKNDIFVELYAHQLGLLLARKYAEDLLQAENERLANIIEGTNVGTWEWNVQTGIITFDELSAGFLGYTLDELSPIRIESWEKLVHPDDIEGANEQLTKVFAREKEYFDIESRMKHKNGSWIWEHDRGKVTSWAPDGKPLCMNGMYIDISERKKAEEKLQNARILLNAGIESPKDMIIFAIDKGYNYLFFNRVHKNIMKLIYGKEIEIGMNLLDCIVLETDKINTKTNFYRALNGESHSTIQEFGDKVPSFYETFYNPIFNENHEIVGATAFARDISERKNAEKALIFSENRFKTMFNEAPLGIALIDSVTGQIYSVNPMFAKIAGRTMEEMTNIDWMSITHPDDIQKDLDNMALLNDGKINGFQMEKRYLHKDGAFIWINMTIASVFVEDRTHPRHLCMIEDITERKKTEDEIVYLSFHDQLTGLYNRRFFEEELKRLNTQRKLPLSIIMGDLNGLKIMNDTFGHYEGDRILVEVSEILKRVCRSGDILARWGGDEFVILLPKTSIADAEEIAERIRNECKKTGGQKIPISLSLGAETKEKAGQDIQTVLMDAESNMYKNKTIEKESLISSIIFALDRVLYEKSDETKEHTDKIQDLSLRLGKSVKLSEIQLDELLLLASFHDIGKVVIPGKILFKKGKLTQKEWSVVKRHPEIGFNIAQSSLQISHIAKSILACHENYDGSGYPLGLKGESIPVMSRIILIADAYNVMISGRAYKPAMSSEDAVTELKRCAGTQFDPALVEKFIEILEKK